MSTPPCQAMSSAVQGSNGRALQAGHGVTMRAAAGTAPCLQDAGTSSPGLRRSLLMETLLDGVNHIALLTTDMDRCIRFYHEVFEAHVAHDHRHHAGHVGARMVIIALGGQSAFNVF